MNINTTDKVQVGDSTTGTSTSTSTTWHCPYTQPKAEQGWECPRCGHINAPWVRQCDCSRSNWTITSDWTYKPEWWKDYVTCGDADNVLNNPNIYTAGGSDYWDTSKRTYVNVSGTQSNARDWESVTTAWNHNPSTKTIHNGKTNYKE